MLSLDPGRMMKEPGNKSDFFSSSSAASLETSDETHLK